jgi:hypothetical protein
MTEREINQRVAEQLCQEARWNGREFRPGEWVALLDGKVVAVAPDLDGALQALRALDANPLRGMVFEVGPPVTDVIRRGQPEKIGRNNSAGSTMNLAAASTLPATR